MSEKKQWELVYDEKGENPVVARVEAYRALMMLTGFDYTSEHKLVNGYVSDRGTGNPQYSQPWMMFMTTWGPVVVGWRKRVINIEWHDSKYPSLVVEPPDLDRSRYDHPARLRDDLVRPVQNPDRQHLLVGIRIGFVVIDHPLTRLVGRP